MDQLVGSGCMSNAAARGYAAMAMEALGYSAEEIERVGERMYAMMDSHPKTEAETHKYSLKNM